MTILLGSQCDVLTRQLGVAHLRRAEMCDDVQVVGGLAICASSVATCSSFRHDYDARFLCYSTCVLASNIRARTILNQRRCRVVRRVLRPDRLGGFPSTLRTTLRRGCRRAFFLCGRAFAAVFLAPRLVPPGRRRVAPARPAAAATPSSSAQIRPTVRERRKSCAVRNASRVYTPVSHRAHRTRYHARASERVARGIAFPPAPGARVPAAVVGVIDPGTRSLPLLRTEVLRHDHLSQHIHRRHARYSRRPSLEASSTARVRDQLSCPSAPLTPATALAIIAL